MASWTQKLHLRRNDPDTSRLWVPKSVQLHRRPHWRPVTRGFESATAQLAAAGASGGPLPLSRFGGRPLVGYGGLHPEWRRPSCGHCGQLMALFLQLDERELPEAAPRSFGDGVLQLFYCVSEEPLCEAEAEAFVAFGDATLVRVVPPDAVARLQVGPQPVESVGPNLPSRLITGWVSGEDFPSHAELKRLGLKRSDAVMRALDRLFPASVDKLGGWPYWKDHVCYPHCPECDREMDLVFQIESAKNLAHTFGPAPCAYVFGCSGGEGHEHPPRLGFGWAYGA
ncbi:MAG: hypothetical protein DWQ36_09005 [Acidobacteria bacterium]|mgnify:CR=1 FL=1|nr:MAG: hypothetical protein DWQ30_22250 [Acidobacteriota bacterium]REK08500.1 MAG: hypothetical protein DWQ36_09005 [Acidobacteriota bacterium]